MRTRLIAPLVAAALLLTTGFAVAAEPTLTTHGDVYFVEQGRYGDLFPDGTAADADASVLAISALRGDGSAERLLVPGTADLAAEQASSLVAGPADGGVYLLWQAGTESSRLRLSRLGDEGWAPEVDVSRGSAVAAGSPRVVATRDTSLLSGEQEGETFETVRGILHVAWMDEDGEAIYAPVVIENGEYLGDHAQFTLSAYAPEELEASESSAQAGSLTLEPGRDGAAVAAFTDPASGQLVSLELRPIAGELSQLGDELRDGILNLINDLEPGDPDSLGTLAGGARAHLISVGRHVRPAILGILAAELERYVRDAGGDWGFQPEAMAARTRAHLISVGATFDRTPISNMHGGARAHLISVGRHLEMAQRSHDLSVSVAAARPAPELPPETVSAVYLSSSGRDALVAWAEDGLIYYRESDGEAWGPAMTLGIDGDSDPELVDKLLSQRARGR